MYIYRCNHLYACFIDSVIGYILLGQFSLTLLPSDLVQVVAEFHELYHPVLGNVQVLVAVTHLRRRTNQTLQRQAERENQTDR